MLRILFLMAGLTYSTAYAGCFVDDAPAPPAAPTITEAPDHMFTKEDKLNLLERRCSAEREARKVLLGVRRVLVNKKGQLGEPYDTEIKNGQDQWLSDALFSYETKLSDNALDLNDNAREIAKCSAELHESTLKDRRLTKNLLHRKPSKVGTAK